MGKFLDWLDEHSPVILVTSGIVSAAATVVLACVATTKAGDILDKHNEELEKIEKAKEIAPSLNEEYTEEDEKKDKLIVFRQTVWGMSKLYLPAAITGIAAVVCTLAGFKILAARYGAAAMALATTQGLFSKYRGNVIKDVGHDKDFEYITGSTIEQKKIEAEVTDPETGKTKKKKVDAEFIDINLEDSAFWFKIFGEYKANGGKNYEWDPNPDVVLFNLRAKENWWTNHLRAKGIVTLNEVLNDVGFDMTKHGQIYGWVYKPGVCDYVSFGLGDYSDENVRRYINHREDSLVLNFNIYGEYDENGTLIVPKPIINCLEG